jgi:hypothetical protein
LQDEALDRLDGIVHGHPRFEVPRVDDLELDRGASRGPTSSPVPGASSSEASPWAGNAPGEVTPWTARFVAAYEARWGLEPEGYGTSSSYMAVYALKDAVERAASLEADAVVEALESIDRPYHLPVAPPPDDEPPLDRDPPSDDEPPNELLDDQPSADEEELESDWTSMGRTTIRSSPKPQCWQVRVICSSPVDEYVGSIILRVRVAKVRAPQLGHGEYGENHLRQAVSAV